MAPVAIAYCAVRNHIDALPATIRSNPGMSKSIAPTAVAIHVPIVTNQTVTIKRMLSLQNSIIICSVVASFSRLLTVVVT